MVETKLMASAANHDPDGRLHSINQEGRPTLLILGCKNSLVYFRAQIFTSRLPAEALLPF